MRVLAVLVLLLVVSAVVSTGSTTRAAEPRRFWVQDTHRYTSPWYAGARRR